MVKRKKNKKAAAYWDEAAAQQYITILRGQCSRSSKRIHEAALWDMCVVLAGRVAKKHASVDPDEVTVVASKVFTKLIEGWDASRGSKTFSMASRVAVCAYIDAYRRLNTKKRSILNGAIPITNLEERLSVDFEYPE